MKDDSSKVTPFIIGLTGAIGTGKSVIRKMLEHKGALTIDADQLAHEAYAKGTNGFHALVQHFGNEILDKNSQIDRKRLGDLVFRNSQALFELESIIHPLVTQAIKRVIDLSPLPIIVVEAIKLLESDLHEHCDVIWAVTSRRNDIYQRLSETRGMSSALVDERLGNQHIQNIDKSLIDKTISNQGDTSDLWANLSVLWDDLSRKSETFGTALTVTQEIMKPFHKYLIKPNVTIQTHAVSEINKRGLFFLPVRYLDSTTSQSNREYFDPSCLKNNLYQYFLWKSEESPKKVLYLISDIDNFISTSAASVNEFDPGEFIKIIGIAQDFSHLHLCEKFFFPFNRESAPLSDAMGFDKTISDILPDADLSPLVYNLLCKKLRPPLELFREK